MCQEGDRERERGREGERGKERNKATVEPSTADLGTLVNQDSDRRSPC